MTRSLYQAIAKLCLILGLFIVLSKAYSLSEVFIPQEVVQKFLNGYSESELELIQDDLTNIRKLCFRNTTPMMSGEKIYLATAGGPGAGKSTLLEIYLRNKKNFVYLDPDQRALRFMINTYLQEFTNAKVSENKVHTRTDWMKLLDKAYTKWRGSSNYIASTLLNEAFKEGYNIAHGTTSTSDQIGSLYQKLKDKEYKIHLLLSYATDDNRVKSLEHRTNNQNFTQNQPNDSVIKGKLFSDRFPIYFQYADEMEIYWVDHYLENATLAATLIRGKGMTVHNQNALKKFTEQYDDDRKNKPLKPLKEYMEDFVQAKKLLAKEQE